MSQTTEAPETLQPSQTAVMVEDECTLKIPLPTYPRADILNPTFKDLIEFSLLRIQDTIDCDIESAPPKLFPLAESTRATFFTRSEWEEFGNLETEIARLTYTLSRYPDRSFPSVCAPTLLLLLDGISVLEGWTKIRTKMRIRVERVVRETLQTMQASRLQPKEKTLKSHFITIPTDYKTCKQASAISISLWERSLAEIASQFRKKTAEVTHAQQFLEIHAFLKDPFGGLRKPFAWQLSIFGFLTGSFRDKNQHRNLTCKEWQRVAAQAAQESSYLATSELDQVAYIHFHRHQQLPYVYTRLNQLARAEFTEPKHVLDIIDEILSDKLDFESCRIVPIAIAFYPSFEGGQEMPLKIIIDGNHRATALMTLRFLATQHHKPPNSSPVPTLQDYCQTQGLGPKWLVDLQDVLAYLYGDEGTSYRQLLAAKKDLVTTFAHVEYIPALVVQEENFHTICKQRVRGGPNDNNPVVLLPMHQALFNEEALGLGFPQRAAQAHGRPLGFKALPFR